MKKQIVALTVVAALSMFGLPACSSSSNDNEAKAPATEQGSSNDAGQSSSASDAASKSADAGLKYSATLKSGSSAVVEYGAPVNVVGSPVMHGNDSNDVRYVFDCAKLSSEGAEGISSSQVLDAMNSHIMTFEDSEFNCVGTMKSVSVSNQKDMTVAGTQMTKYVGTIDGSSDSRPFVGYATITDDLATWFYVVDSSKDASNSPDVLEGWADKIAQSYRVVE